MLKKKKNTKVVSVAVRFGYFSNLCSARRVISLVGKAQYLVRTRKTLKESVVFCLKETLKNFEGKCGGTFFFFFLYRYDNGSQLAFCKMLVLSRSHKSGCFCVDLL